MGVLESDAECRGSPDLGLEAVGLNRPGEVMGVLAVVLAAGTGDEDSGGRTVWRWGL